MKHTYLIRDTNNNENVIASPFAFVIARRSRSNLILIAQGRLRRSNLKSKIPRGVYPERRKNKILRYAQNDRRRARNDREGRIFK